MSTIKFNDAEVQEMFREIAARLGDLTEPMAAIGDMLVKSTIQRFDEGISPEGVPWAAKSLATIDAYRQRSESRNTKMDNRPLHGPSGSLSSTIYAQTGPTAARVGSPMVYAATMQFGALKGEFGTASNNTPIPWGNIPARPFLGFSEDDRTAILETLTEWLEDADD